MLSRIRLMWTRPSGFEVWKLALYVWSRLRESFGAVIRERDLGNK